MKEYGQELSVGDQKDYITLSTRRESEAMTKQMEMEGVLRSIHNKHLLMMKNCVHCKRPFETNLCWTTHCSDACRYAEFQKKYGIAWDDLKVQPTQGFWEYEPVLNISPDRVEAMADYCRWFLSHYEELKAESLEYVQTQDYLDSLEEPDPPQSIEEPAHTALPTPDTEHIESESAHEMFPPLPDLTEEFDPFELDLSEFDVDPFQ
jgi:hypothetical protein